MLRAVVLTEVVVKGELVIVPNLDGEFRSKFSLGFIDAPEVFLQTREKQKEA